MDKERLLDALMGEIDGKRSGNMMTAVVMPLLGKMDTDRLERLFRENVHIDDARGMVEGTIDNMGIGVDDIVPPGETEERGLLLDVMAVLMMGMDPAAAHAFLLLMRRFVLPMAKRERAMERTVELLTGARGKEAVDGMQT